MLGYKVNLILINVDNVLKKFQHLEDFKGPMNAAFQRENKKNCLKKNNFKPAEYINHEIVIC